MLPEIVNQFLYFLKKQKVERQVKLRYLCDLHYHNDTFQRD